MTADVTSSPWRDRLTSLDSTVFRIAASHRWPGAEQVLPRLSRSANHGVLWFAAGAGLYATRSPRARRAAVRGLVSLGLASATVNTIGKRAVRRARPLRDAVPLVRQLKRQPLTTSFPSGHAASAAAFAAGVTLESRALGALVAPVAFSVAASRVYTGVHYPSDVLAGAALGVGAALAVRGLVPTRDQMPVPARLTVGAPRLPRGAGLVVVVNRGAGSPDRVRSLRDALPEAEVVECEGPALADELEKAARRAKALGISGGDGSINTAAGVALRHELPLVVLPGGTLNHFAYDLGIEDVRDAYRAVELGEAVLVDVGRWRTECRDAEDGWVSGLFLNTFSLGVYPELVQEREKWSGKLGGRLADVAAAVHVLRRDRPLLADIGGHREPLWLLFAGNGLYGRPGLTAGRRTDLADGLLDVRTVRGGGRPSARLLGAALAGPLTRSPFHAARRLHRLRVTGIEPGTPLAHDGEVAEAGSVVELDKLHEALTVYRPIDV
ncbi:MULTISPECIES: bifunctional phosphatase PAP2/diacylglycerol kinase family protein [Streptomyces]|uniref:Phosphatase PAP2 family protein n=2 Tax=Streptomyces TaxID=1883 RepID=A0ABU2R0X5_9ACTN|nr:MULTISPECIES: phosphatase PAP2 family protein [unclassified Streptomyces]MDT0409744.1 phosphatase PAP2 family protein [Streptomyces sp. DSM 41979]WEH30754.1 phosphatase PAP2 family protein [Streptomyces sp. AM 3-1-1]SCD42710.1 undecaprenyl-diphosphatase [Streptomyces sp. DfronAA-171]